MTRPHVLCIGEAMVEMAPLSNGTYQQGYAGDTFNTAWHMAQLLRGRATVGFATRVGRDAISDAFVAEMAEDRLSTDAVQRSTDRTMGLYLISLDGIERSFHYWRSMSAARQLADDPTLLARAFDGADLIHVSGITVAILPPKGRNVLLDALAEARATGTQISFDPNIRPALWSGMDEIRATLPDFFAAADILLPSFDDEHLVWGDADPVVTLDRLGAPGKDVIVKNGEDSVHLSVAGTRSEIPTPRAEAIADTTGAGDAFNAGFLAGRLEGRTAEAAVALGQATAATCLAERGARGQKSALATLIG
ncbi:MAG: sugar kinase [Pseudomonadota bacterium]